MQIELKDYTVEEQLLSGYYSLIFRGKRKVDKLPVIIKLLKSDRPTLDEIAKLENEYEILKDFKSSGVIQVYDLVKYRNLPVLVVEDIGGKPLEEYIQKKPLDFTLRLKIAIAFAKSISDIHQQEIIHCDIKPSNVILSLDPFILKLTDFGLAIKRSLSTPLISTPRPLEGSLAYISPEQTGRIDRDIDYRSDLYSFGVSLYELFSGSLPFQSKDPLEIIHSHIAKHPIPLHELTPSVPKQVSLIISKLMAKSPEDRYKSIYGVIADLEKCFVQYEKERTIEEFPLGQKDISHHFQLPQKFYGRAKEKNTLFKAFEKSKQERSLFVLISGEEGVGKTKLVQELRPLVIDSKGYFISGKCDEQKKSVPYSSLIDSFQELVRQILSENEKKIQRWKKRFLDELGDNIEDIIDIVPDLKKVVDIPKKNVSLSSKEHVDQFRAHFQKFIKVLSSKDHPLVIFIDDIQWADLATIKLIEYIMDDTNIRGLLFVGCLNQKFFENSKESVLTPFAKVLGDISLDESHIFQINLPPFSEHDIKNLLIDSIASSLDVTENLSKVLYSKTEGNPSLVIQLLYSLNRKGILYFDGEKGRWECDIAKVQSIKVSDNVVESLIKRWKGLSKEVRQILKKATCIGEKFDLTILSYVCKIPLQTIILYIRQATKEGIIAPVNEFGKKILKHQTFLQEDSEDNHSYLFCFLHNEVYQIANSELSADLKIEVHEKIGRYLLFKTPPEELDSQIFTIVHHLNLAAKIVDKKRDRRRYAEINLIAGWKAINTTAYELAYKYFDFARKFLSDESWNSFYSLTLSVYLGLCESAYLAGKFDLAFDFFDQIIKKAKTDLDKILAYKLKLRLLISSMRYKDVVFHGQEALKLLGVNIPIKPSRFQLVKEFLKSVFLLKWKGISNLLTLPVSSNIKQIEIINLLILLIPPSYFLSKDLLGYFALKSFNLTLRYGHTPDSPIVLTSYGMILAGISEDIKSSQEIGSIALTLRERNSDMKNFAGSTFIFGAFLNYYHVHLRSNLSYLFKAYEVGVKTGDFIYSSFALALYLASRFFVSDNLLDVLSEIRKHQDFFKKIKAKNLDRGITALSQMILALNEETESPCSLKSNSFSEDTHFRILEEPGYEVTRFYSYHYKTRLYYYMERYEEAVSWAKKGIEHGQPPLGQFVEKEANFFYSLSLAAHYSFVTPSQQKRYLSQLLKNQKRLRKWSESSPANYHHKYLLVEAEIKRILEKKEEAYELYDQAIEEARENGYLQDEALANELLAKFYLSQRKLQLAGQFMQEAIYGYYRWGTIAKIRDIEQKYPELFDEDVYFPVQNASNFKNALPQITITSSSTSNEVDLHAVIKASQKISEEIDFRKVSFRTLEVVVDLINTEKAFLLTYQTSHFAIAAYKLKGKPIETDHLSTSSLEEKLPLSLIKKVEEEREVILLGDATANKEFVKDPYIVKQMPMSILCYPLNYQGKLIGILYFEHPNELKAFNKDNVDLLNMLCPILSMSIEKAILYDQLQKASNDLSQINKKLEEKSKKLEVKVAERSKELTKKNKELNETIAQFKSVQKQLSHQETLASLGALSKGIAHEISNPLNFVNNFSNLTEDLLEEAKEAVKQQDIESAKELFELIKQNLEKIKEHGKRAEKIAVSMLGKMTIKEEKQEKVNLNQLLEETIDIVSNAYQETQIPLKVDFQLEFDKKEPYIEVKPSEMGKVLYHLLDNAYYAVLEKKRKEKENYTPQIKISTKVLEDMIEMRIRDNGVGIPNEIKKKVMIPFFTTKPTGFGTGLGLSASYDVICNKYQGDLQIESKEQDFTEVKVQIKKAN